jgi:hypothetical protein
MVFDVQVGLDETCLAQPGHLLDITFMDIVAGLLGGVGVQHVAALPVTEVGLEDLIVHIGLNISMAMPQAVCLGRST